MLAALALLALAPQDPSPAATAAAAAAIRVTLQPAPAGERGPRWSPKGATVPLAPAADAADAAEPPGALEGSFALGPAATPAVRVRLEKSADAEHFDRLFVDCDRDGSFAEGELRTATPREQRGKWWSSFEATVAIPVPADGDAAATTRPYPMSLWFVEDPQEPDAKPVLRWSRRGFHEGTCTIDGRVAHVMITESAMDGVFDQRDAWQIARERDALFGTGVRSMEQHCWLDGVAWQPVAIDEHGRTLAFERIDPGMTEAEEKEKADRFKPDREAKRAERPLAFGHDLAAALAEAGTREQRVLVDFQTTWCGPCRQMEQWVFTAADVVAAAEGVIAVKLDGDAERDLVRRYEVQGYPTLLLLDAEGKVLRRAVGYRSVAQMVAFLAR